jgi:hypothetical protein
MQEESRNASSAEDFITKILLLKIVGGFVVK